MLRTRSVTLGAALLLLPWMMGCVTIAEFRKLEYEVHKLCLLYTSDAADDL